MATKIGAPKNEFPIKSAESMLPVIAGNTVFVVADTETTGFGAYDDILEIGAVKIDVETHKVIQSFSTYCRMKNHQKVPQKIVDLTGIHTEDVAEAPKIETVLPAFRQFVDGCPIVFHNAAFDWRMLGNKYKLLGTRLNNDVICTMKLFKYLHPEAEASNLDFITKFYGTPIVGHHRAVVDCKWTAAAFCKMRDEVPFEEDAADGIVVSQETAQKFLSLLDEQKIGYTLEGDVDADGWQFVLKNTN